MKLQILRTLQVKGYKEIGKVYKDSFTGKLIKVEGQYIDLD